MGQAGGIGWPSSRCSAGSRTPSSSGWPCSTRHPPANGTPAEGGTPAATPGFNQAGDPRPGSFGARSGSWPHFTLIIDDLHELTCAGGLAQLTRLLDDASPAGARDPGDAPQSAAAAAPASPGRRPGRDPYRRICAFTERETRELLDASGIALSRDRGRAAAPADGRLGRGPTARGDLTGRPPRPGAICRRVLRQQPHRRRVPARRDAGAPAARGPAAAAAHLPARPGQRRAGRPADRPPGLGTDPAGPRRRERVRRIARPRARTWFRYHHLFADLAPAGAAPDAARGSAGAAPARRRMVQRARPRSSTPSGTPRPRATGPTRPGCSPTIRSA